MPEKERIIYFALSFIIIISLICHFLFSWIGFNPTDDGFILSLSRRILDGEVPHKDFIFIRPALSAVIHIPEVYFGREFAFWFSRYFVWIELTSIACLWTYIIANKFFQIPFERYLYFFLALSCYVFSVYTSFIMAYTTYDALFLYSVGLLLCLRQSNSSIFTGCFFIGLAYLCRQNFILMVPITLVLLGYTKFVRFWLAALLPAILYILFMALLGALDDFVGQVMSLSNRFHGGLKVYMFNPGFWASIPAGYIILLKLYSKSEANNADNSFIPRLLVSLIIIVSGVIFLYTDAYPLYISFCFFGMVLGMILYFLKLKKFEYFRFGLIILLTAWCTSISIGLSYPALLSGQLFIFIFVLVAGLNTGHKVFLLAKGARSVLLYIFMIAVLAAGFGYARYSNVYRDRQSSELNYSIGGVLQGANRIFTNENTYLYLEDLQKAVIKAGEKEYCILPDAACYWVKLERRNPLPISWANKTEIGDEEIFQRITESLNSRDSLVIILEKVYANSLHKGFLPLPMDESYSPIVQYVVKNFRKIDITSYFELYMK